MHTVYTPLYEKGIKKTQIKSMKTTEPSAQWKYYNTQQTTKNLNALN